MYKFLFLFLFLFHQGIGQMKYKDIEPTFAGMGNEELKNALKEFLLLEDPDHPNANFRLALVYESNFRSADVLTQYEYLLANAEQARLRFTKARQLVDIREVSRNNDYYATIFKIFDEKGKPSVDFEVVSNRIFVGLDSSTLYLANVPPIYRNFTKSVNFYDNAVKIFNEINNGFLSLDDIYLYFDPVLDKKMIGLKTNYDSARFYFDRYLELTKAFPIPFHKQKYHVKPIFTYRLDGLITRMNFLTNDVEFWDYGAWVDAVHKSIKDEILSLRTRLSQNEVRLSENLTKISGPDGAGVVPVMLDKQLVFNLNNFDKQSLALALLEYKYFKQDWLLKANTYTPDTLNLERNATIFSTLIYSNLKADTLINLVKSRATKEKIKKHREFIDTHYGGSEGLQKYIDGEKESIRVTYEQYSGGLRSSLLNMATTPSVSGADRMLHFGKWIIPTTVHPVTPEMLAKGDPITLQSRKSPDGSVYLAGIHKPDKKTNATVTYVARVNAAGKPGWIQNFSIHIDSLATVNDANSFLGPFELTQEGCAFIVRSVHKTNPVSKNAFVYLNEKGEQKFLVRLAEKGFPRQIDFTEKSNSFVLLFKGQQEAPNFTTAENLTLVGVNALGDVLWKRQLGFAGTLTDFVNLIDGHMLVGNYAALKDLQGKEYKAKPGESNPFMVKFSGRGDIEAIQPIPTAKPVFVMKVVKVTDRSINLLGKEGNVESTAGKLLTREDNLVHIMSNRLCEVVCSNLPK